MQGRLAQLEAQDDQKARAQAAEAHATRRQAVEAQVASHAMQREVFASQEESQARQERTGSETLRWTKWGVFIALFAIVVTVILARCQMPPAH
jgi:hypothetical protein